MQRADGEPFEARNRMTLCRCGAVGEQAAVRRHPRATPASPTTDRPTVLADTASVSRCRGGVGRSSGRWRGRELWHAARARVLVVPVGSCEQHGPHLPLDTDTRIAIAIADGLVEAYTDGARRHPLVLAPAADRHRQRRTRRLPRHAVDRHRGVRAVVVELVRSADWSGGVVLVNGHGGNAEAVSRAVATLRTRRPPGAGVVAAGRGGDAHAGETETSVMLALAPALVRTTAMEPGRSTEPIGDVRRPAAPRWRSGRERPTACSAIPTGRRRATAAHCSPGGTSTWSPRSTNGGRERRSERTDVTVRFLVGAPRPPTSVTAVTVHR